MKQYLAATTAIFSALIAVPAHAELNLDIGGHFRGYGAYSNNDVAASSTHEFEFRRDTEIHFTGEATSDNGLTVGAHYEAMVGSELLTDEAYAYFAGNWGRVNFGSEDGAAYLLQVAAPSADSNVDGLRSSVQAINSTAFDTTVPLTAAQGAVGYTGVFSSSFGTNALTNTNNLILDYDHADFQDTDRITYLTPKYSGFQAGVSYAPKAGQNLIGNGLSAPDTDNDVNEFENLWEASIRWDGEFEGFGISAGAGYSNASAEQESLVAGNLADDLDTWNAGLNVAFRGFSVGGSYLDTETAVGTGAAALDAEGSTWVIGAAWDNGPYHVGVSYLDQDIELGAAEIDANRVTAGVGYTYGPGMSFRGAVAVGETEENVTPTSEDFTQVTIGTDIQF